MTLVVNAPVNLIWKKDIFVQNVAQMCSNHSLMQAELIIAALYVSNRCLWWFFNKL